MSYIVPSTCFSTHLFRNLYKKFVMERKARISIDKICFGDVKFFTLCTVVTCYISVELIRQDVDYA